MTTRREVGTQRVPLEERDDAVGALPVFAVASVVLRRWRWMVWVPIACIALAVVYSIVRPRPYIASSRFMPQGTQGGASAGLSGIAVQFGVSLGGGGTDSPEFYVALVTSRELLLATAATHYRFATEPGGTDTLSGTLVELYEIESDDPDRALRSAAGVLFENLRTSIDLKANLVQLEVAAPWPLLAEQINRRILELVNEFNLSTRRSQARAEREFIEGRRAEALAELRAAEAEFSDFLEKNRRFEGSPELRFRADALHRKVGLAQQVCTSLSQQYDRARIEEVRNAPVVTVIEPPEGAARRPGRAIILHALAGAFLGFLLAVLLAFGKEYLERQRAAYPMQYAEFTRLRRIAAAELGKTIRIRR